MKKTLVTGAAGFIGSALTQRLIDRGDEVWGLDNLNSYYDPQLKLDRLNRLQNPRFHFLKVDLCDRAAMEKVFKDNQFDVVVNLAAQAGVRYSLTHPYAYTDSNLIGFQHILEGCRHHKPQHLVFASSSSVYGANRKLPFSVEDSVDHPVSLYAATKKANELTAHCYSHLYGIPTTGLRFFTVYGPWGRPDMALFRFTKNILEGKPIEVFNYGKHRRDFTYIDDIIEGVIRVMDGAPKPNPQGKTSAPYRLYNIGNNQPVDLEEFIAVLEATLGKKAEKKMLPMQEGDVLETYADITSLVADFDFRPQTSIRDGVKKFVDWYRSYFRS